MKRMFPLIIFPLIMWFMPQSVSASVCVTVDNQGRLYQSSSETFSNCSESVLLDTIEYTEYRENNTYQEEAAELMLEGMIKFFIVGMFVGVVTSMIKKMR